MDWSPILISMKTASVSIVLTFFLGILAAWWVVSMKNERMKILLDGHGAGRSGDVLSANVPLCKGSV